jgi:hypothetical protein
LILNQAHLLHALREYEHHPNEHRPHRGIAAGPDQVQDDRAYRLRLGVPAIDAPAHPTCRRMRPLRQRGVTGITAGGESVLPRRVVLREVMRQPDVLMRRCCAGLLDMTALADTGPHVALRGCGHPSHDLDRPAMTRVSQYQG